MVGAALGACYDQEVARGCGETCNRNVLRALNKLEIPSGYD